MSDDAARLVEEVEAIVEEAAVLAEVEAFGDRLREVLAQVIDAAHPRRRALVADALRRVADELRLEE